MDKIKVLMLHIAYPLSMSRYFQRAFMRRDDVDFRDCGPYTGSWIPWMGGMTLSNKYAVPPTYVLPFPPNVGQVSYDLVKAQMGDWKPDIVLTVDAGVHWSQKPNDGIVVHVATDSHCLDYDYQRKISDKFFNMHGAYSITGDLPLPYAFDPSICYPEDVPNLDDMKDAVLIGMPYDQRVMWVNELRKNGVSVIFENGPVFDEYRELNNHARIGLNWSSLNDLNCRVFELMAMQLCPVINRVSDLGQHFVEGTHYLGFSSLEEGVEKVLWAKNNPEDARRIAINAHDEVCKLDGKYPQHSYDNRVDKILKECGYANSN
jgi:hypothetical protein